MENEDLYNFLISESNHSFSGWNFTYINDRLVDYPLIWNYTSIILPYIRKVEKLLDMGTGGGELLASLTPLPKYTCATEAFKPNVSIAKNRLEPLGVKVTYIESSENLPFKDDEFDVIINRHEEYSVKEVYRILKPKGYFITQQVGNKNNASLRKVLTGFDTLENETKWNLDYAVDELRKSDFKIIYSNEDVTKTRIFDVGAIV